MNEELKELLIDFLDENGLWSIWETFIEERGYSLKKLDMDVEF